MAEEKVVTKFGADTEEAESGIDRIVHKLKDMPAPVRELLEAFGELRKTLVEAFAIREAVEFIEKISEIGEQAIRTSEMLGISVEKVEELGYAAKATGGSSESMATTLTRLERNMAEAQAGTGQAYEAFRNLGISLDDLKSKSPDQIIGMIADRFHDTEDSANKTAYALDLMGRSGAELIPVLNQGSEGLKVFADQAKETGTVLSEGQAEGLEKTHQGLVQLKTSVEGAGVSLFEVFHPAIDAVIGGLTLLIQRVKDFLDGLHDLAVLIESAIVVKIAEAVAQFESWKVAGTAALDAIRIGFETLGQIIDDVVHLHFAQAVADWESGSKRIVAAETNAAAEIAGISAQYESYKDKVLKAAEALFTFSDASEKGKKGSLPPAPTTRTPQGAEEDNGDLDDAKNAEATKIALAKLGFEQQKELDQAALDAGKITNQQKIANEESYAALQFQIENEALERQKSLYSEGEVEYHQVLNRQQILAAQYNLELTKLSAQAAKAQAADAKKLSQEYRPVFDVIGRDFDSMLTGVLQGTQTWQQAIGNLFSNVAVSAVEALAKIMAEYLAFLALTEGQGTWDSFVALEKPGGAGVSSLLPSFAVGSWNVPGDMTANIHQGEMIIPAAQAQSIRDGGGSIGGGGSSNVTINIQAIDTQTGAQFLKQNAGVIAQSLQSHMRLNPSAR